MTLRKRIERLGYSTGICPKPPRVTRIQVIDAFSQSIDGLDGPQARTEFSLLWQAGEWRIVTEGDEWLQTRDGKA